MINQESQDPKKHNMIDKDQEYAERDILALDKQGGYYSRHLSAMTGENLHSKSDIAAELAWRDMMIDRLRGQVAEIEKQSEGEAEVSWSYRAELDELKGRIELLNKQNTTQQEQNDALVEERDALAKYVQRIATLNQEIETRSEYLALPTYSRSVSLERQYSDEVDELEIELDQVLSNPPEIGQSYKSHPSHGEPHG